MYICHDELKCVIARHIGIFEDEFIIENDNSIHFAAVVDMRIMYKFTCRSPEYSVALSAISLIPSNIHHCYSSGADE
jgi:hypothetical protein